MDQVLLFTKNAFIFKKKYSTVIQDLMILYLLTLNAMYLLHIINALMKNSPSSTEIIKCSNDNGMVKEIIDINVDEKKVVVGKCVR